MSPSFGKFTFYTVKRCRVEPLRSLVHFSVEPYSLMFTVQTPTHLTSVETTHLVLRTRPIGNKALSFGYPHSHRF